MISNQIKSILKHFPVGKPISIVKINKGLIHQTFKVVTTKGVFALQRLHSLLATKELMSDFKHVTDFLKKNNFPAPQPVLTYKKQISAKDDLGYYWRLLHWIEGNSFDVVSSQKQVFNAALLLGKFHSVMRNYSGGFKAKLTLHKTSLYLTKLNKTADEFQASPWLDKISSIINEINELLPPLLLPDLPVHVVHGDPKFSNFLFNKSNETVAIIDLDSTSKHSVLVDLGDAIRSWCRNGEEDIPTPFLKNRYNHLIKGYSASPAILTKEEESYIFQAGIVITLELTARFCIDVLKNNYFGWNNKKYPNRQEHNLARAKAMLFLAKNMLMLRNKKK